MALRGPFVSIHFPKVAADAPRMKIAMEKIQASCVCVQSLGSDLVMPISFVIGSLNTLKA